MEVPKISNFCASDTGLAVIRAETLFTAFLVEHNIPLAAADHAGNLFRKMFPDSKIAKDYKCCRTKTGHIVRAVSDEAVKESSKKMAEGPFVVGTDGSQEGGDKFFPVVVRHLDGTQISKMELIGVPTCKEAATGKNIFNLMHKCIEQNGLSWDNCMALVSDNANVMVGNEKGVIACLREENEMVHLAGCVCHLLNLAAKKATKAYQGEFNFDDVLRQMGWYIDNSSGRQNRLKEQQALCNTPQVQFQQHCPTRWLSLGASLRRLLEQWEPMQKFFEDECSQHYKQKQSDEEFAPKKTPDSIKLRVKAFLQRRTAKLYSFFLSFAIEMFDKVNKDMQTDAALIHRVKRTLEAFYKKLLNCFIKPSALNQGLITDVDFKSAYNIKKDADLMIGQAAQEYLKVVSKSTRQKFYADVVLFFQAACQYMKVSILSPKKKDPHPAITLWKHAEVADPQLRTDAAFSSLKFFTSRFVALKPSSMDDLQIEFNDYQSCALPKDLDSKPVEQQWTEIAALKDASGSLRFKVLPRVMLGILLIPVSNAACERVFSQVRRNQTDFRGSLGAEQMEALLVWKTSMQGRKCFEQSLPDPLLRKCKSSTTTALNGK